MVVGLTSLALLATVLATKGWSDDNGVPDPGVTWGAPSGHDVVPGPDSVPSPAASPSAASASDPVEIGQGRLRSRTADLCLDIRGDRVGSGARTGLALCSSAPTQQWSYQADGLLRSLADPTLCLDSAPRTGAVVLAGCLVHSGEVQYDLTVRGELLLRWHKGLVVAPGEGMDVVVTRRDGSEDQRWSLDVADAATGEVRKKADEGEGTPEGKAEPRLPSAPSVSPDAQRSRPDGPDGHAPEGQEQRQEYEPRMAQVDHREEPEEPEESEEPEQTGVLPVPLVHDVVTAVESVLP